MDRDPRTLIAWESRSSEFGQLVKHVRDHTATVAMEFLPLSYDERWSALRSAWLALPRHGSVIVPLGGGTRFLLRYAALVWGEQLPLVSVSRARMEALQIYQLASVYQMLLDAAPANLGLFLNPLVKIDLGGFVRVCFLPVEQESTILRPTAHATVREERLVRFIGKLARKYIPMTQSTPTWDVLERCLSRSPRPFQTLNDLMDACQRGGFEYPFERMGSLGAAWTDVEQGLGWLQMPETPDCLERASDHFQSALELARDDRRSGQYDLVRKIARWGRETCDAKPGRSGVSVWDEVSGEPDESGPVADVHLARLRAAAAWRKRDFSFRDLRTFDDGRPIVAMECSLAPKPGWEELRDAWLAIERPCAILDAVGYERNELLVRYAALNWKLPPLYIDTPDRVRMACAWLVDLVDAYKILAAEAAEAIPWFLNPVAKIDLNLRPRIWFLATPPERHELPPEVLGKNATWDERTLVFQVGHLMKRLVQFHVDEDTPFRHIVTACGHDRPWKRWKNLEALIEAIGLLDIDVAELRAARRPAGWDQLEEGLGWLDLGENEQALAAFRETAQFPEFAEMAASGEVFAQHRIDESRTIGVVSGSFMARPLQEAEPIEKPWSLRHRLPFVATPVEAPIDTLERARRAFRLGDLGHAAALAHQARLDIQHARGATLLLAEVHLRRRQFEDALRWLEPLLAPGDDARAEYIRAKAMFASGRLHEAHAAFERTLKLAPTMIEAMLLRREVDRALARVRLKAGQSMQADVVVPAGLEELRDVLLSGDSRRAIVALDDAKFHSDDEAQLVLAQFLVFDGQHERALEVYDRITGDHRFTALLGKATTLLALGRDESALAIYDQLVAGRPNDTDASEGRARALEKLGRIGEAAAEYRRFISLATAGSDLRVRAAQEWLDAHPL